MMQAAVFLKEMVRQIRRDTLRMLKAAPADRLTWAPAGTANHVLWHAGHAVWLLDHFCIHPLAGESELPDAWQALFASDSDPADPTHAWPSREAVVKQLEHQWQRTAKLLDAAERDDLPPALEDREAKARFVQSLIHGLHDEARHQGEMYLLLKLCRQDETQPG